MNLTEPIKIEGIEHLDFTPGADSVEVTKEEPEEPKTCQLYRTHPHDPEMQRCGRKAVYEITIAEKPCCPPNHRLTLNICEGCWQETEQKPESTWLCMSHKINYLPKKHIVAWRRL